MARPQRGGGRASGQLPRDPPTGPRRPSRSRRRRRARGAPPRPARPGDDRPAGDGAGVEAAPRAGARPIDAGRGARCRGRRRGRPLRGARLAGGAAGSGSRTASPAATSARASSSSTTSPPRYFEGRTCPLAQLGYSRDGRRGTLQMIYGLLCDRPGRPVAVEVFSGELHDDKTLPAQIAQAARRASA